MGRSIVHLVVVLLLSSRLLVIGYGGRHLLMAGSAMWMLVHGSVVRAGAAATPAKQRRWIYTRAAWVGRDAWSVCCMRDGI